MPRYKLPLLAVDDDETALAFYEVLLRHSDFSECVSCANSAEAMERLAAQQFSAVLLDLNMPAPTGEEVLALIHERQPDLPVIVITAEGDVTKAVACMKAGAWDYLVKPVEKSRLLASLKHAVEMNELRHEVGKLGRRLLDERGTEPEAFPEIITASPAMGRILSYLQAVAPGSIPVLVTGESGTGKEMVARAIHRLSGRRGSFVAVNAAGLDEAVFVDTLFGHRRGAFTGADAGRKGLIEQARDGTLFLDEIGDMGAALQIKLLRLLQEGEYYPLGADTPTMCDARIIAATNVDVTDGEQLRRDLFYRLATYRVHLPPLRERPEDIPPLLEHFVEESARSLGRPAPRVDAESAALLKRYAFPGNVRELRSLVLDALTRLARDELRAEDLEALLRERGAALAERAGARPAGGAPQGISLSGRFPTLSEAEEFLIDQAMRRCSGNQSAAARMLGIAQSTLSRRFRGRSPAQDARADRGLRS
jgi:DNA-binding NtrC family response regulator